LRLLFEISSSASLRGRPAPHREIQLRRSSGSMGEPGRRRRRTPAPGTACWTPATRCRSGRLQCGLHRREIPRLRVPALRAEAKARDTPLGMTAQKGKAPIGRLAFPGKAKTATGCPLRLRAGGRYKRIDAQLA
jgi:hypothetical protein